MKNNKKIITPYYDRLDFLEKIKGFDIKNSCEVGVLRGDYSCEILKRIPSIQTHYAIDSWAPQLNYNDSSSNTEDGHINDLRCATENLQPFIQQGRVKILKGLSIDMCEQIEDDSLDFIYIDARHDYIGVLSDIKSYWPKLKSGGILSGHDYMDASEVRRFHYITKTPSQDWSICEDGSYNVRAVKGAVEDWSAEHNIQVLLSYREPAWHTWCMIKP